TLIMINRMHRMMTLTALATAQLIASDVFVGVWNLDSAKSSFDPGPPPVSQTLRLDNDGGLVKLHLTEVTAAGSSEITASFRFDGKPYPVQGSKQFDSLSATRQDDARFQISWIRNGKVQILCNGRTSANNMVITTTGITDTGKPVKNYRVFVKAK